MWIMLCHAIAREEAFGTAADVMESRWLKMASAGVVEVSIQD